MTAERKHWGIWSLLIMNACVFSHLQAEPEYYIGFLNKTGHKLENVEVYFGNNLVGRPGVLVKMARATEGPITLSVPAEANVKWDDSGEQHSVNVKLQGVVSNGFSDDGTIYFIINEDNTAGVKAIKFGDTKAVAELIRGLHPKGEYRLGFVNKTGHDLRGVAGYYGDKEVCAVGEILARVKVGYSSPLTLQMPAESEVRWKDGSGSHAVKVKLTGVVPKGYEGGTIYFVIKDGETVEVKPIKWTDSQGSINLVK